MPPSARRLAALLWLVTAALVAFAWHAGAPTQADAPRAQAQALATSTP